MGLNIEKDEQEPMNETAVAVAAVIAEDESNTKKSAHDAKKLKRATIRNVIVFSLSFFLQFSAGNALNNLQSSINSKHDLGVTTLLAMSISFIASSLFLPALLIKYAGFKWPMVACESTTLLYILANLYPTWWTLIPAAVLFGAANSVMWTVQGSLITHLAKDYSIFSKQKHDAVLIKFFGFFYIIYQSNHIIGNAISATVFSFNNDTPSINQSNQVCGSYDCPGQSSQVARPDERIIYALCIVFLILSLIGIFLALFFMDNIKPTKDDKTWLQTTFETILIFADKKKLLLFPVYGFSMSFSVFLVVDLSKSYIACGYGRESIGIWFAIWGLSSSIFAMTMSPTTKYILKTILLSIVSIVSIMFLGYLYYWVPSADQKLVFYGLAVVFGYFEAAWGPVLVTLVGVCFSENSGIAYANYRFCSSLILLIALAYSKIFCVKTKIMILIVLGGLCILSLIVLEIVLRKEVKYKKVASKASNTSDLQPSKPQQA